MTQNCCLFTPVPRVWCSVCERALKGIALYGLWGGFNAGKCAQQDRKENFIVFRFYTTFSTSFQNFCSKLVQPVGYRQGTALFSSLWVLIELLKLFTLLAKLPAFVTTQSRPSLPPPSPDWSDRILTGWRWLKLRRFQGGSARFQTWNLWWVQYTDWCWVMKAL